MSARQRTKQSDWEEAVENLRREFEARIDEVSDKLNNPGRLTIPDEAALRNLADDLSKRADEVRDKLDDSLRSGIRAAKDHPRAVLAAALAVGILAGVLLGQRGKSAKSKD